MAAVALASVVASCSAAPAPEVVVESPGPSPSASPTSDRPSPSPSAEPVAALPTLTLAASSGDEEVVFDWSEDACEPDHIPDLATRAFRDADGQVQVIISHYVNYRMSGDELDAVSSDCSSAVLRSDYDEDPSTFNDSEWLAGLYTEDGQTVYGIVHNEYRGHTHAGRCPSGDYFTCLDTSLTMAVSSDGGASFEDLVAPPGHLVATLPFMHDPDGVPSGVRQPSNIIRAADGYFYVFSNVSAYPSQEQWVCLMRTEDLADAGSWRYWDGAGFEGTFINPYTEAVDVPSEHTCAPLARNEIGAQLTESVTFHEESGLYVLVGISADQIAGREVWGFYYSTSLDLLEWSTRELLLEMPLPWTVQDGGRDLSNLYPVLLDPSSASRNFDTISDTPYLYYTRHNRGQGSLDRDLVRVPVEIVVTP